ncbi:MAG: hypothetical protein Q8P10_03480 [bacterium]|nr:hypothetical protein [bacterium]
MKKFINNLKSDKILFLAFLSGFILLLANLLYTLLLYRNLPPYLPLFNQMPWGEKRLGFREQIFLPIFIAFVILLGNSFFSSLLYKKMPLIARILAITSLLVCFFAFLFVVRTIQLIV